MGFGKSRKNGKKSKKSRTTVCIIITAAIFAGFAIRLVDWQLVQGKNYKSLAAKSTGYTEKTDATRGEIVDRNGVGLVVNTTKYKIVLNKLYIEEDRLDGILLELADILTKIGDARTDSLPISVGSDGSCVYKTSSEEDTEKLLSSDFLDMDRNTSADDCFDALLKRYKISDRLSISQKTTLVSIHYNMELEKYSNSNPYVFAKNISRSAVNAVSENTQGVSGVEIQTYLTRGASDPDLAPHILGALGSLSEDEYNELKKQGKSYSYDDKIGKFGIELACEDDLKGKGGTRVIQRNADGTLVESIETESAKPGNTVYLTIDSKLQKTAVKSLEENVKAAKQAGKESGQKNNGEDCETGAVVMLSVKDFSVLAAASYPTYDLNRYSEYGSYYVKLSENKNSPMYNRATVGTFACGSVFKPCVAGAALEEKIITDKTKIYCKQDYDFYPTNVVRCMHYHGSLDVTGAIEQSCNYFFADTGRRLGIEPMYLYAQKFGLGEYTGIEIEESKGTLAGRDSTDWQVGNTVSAAIGQSDNAFTPVQLATYVATIANNGERLKTHIVDKVTNYERTKTVKSTDVESYGDCGISKKNLDIVRKAMLGVTQDENGTANYMFGDYKVKVAAKTGTAENSGSDHTTFICYAPYEKPEVAIAVVIEHGAKGRYSMQVAKDLLDAYFK